MSQFDLTEDQLAIQEMARRFTADAITPLPPNGMKSTISPAMSGRQRRAGLWCDLRVRGIGRHRPRPAGSGADHGGDGLWLPRHQRLHLDPQHGRVDDRRLRRAWTSQARYLPELVSMDEDGELLPDRAGFRIGRGGAQDHARLDGDHYVVNGTKQFISGGGYNDSMSPWSAPARTGRRAFPAS
jgi:alkylation response protein AidB-like acyl-CoA dehydrogenase